MYYVNRILPFAKREGARLFGSTKWVFQQDGATPHTANKSQQWCRNNFKFFLNKHHWPPNSPDLNPLDFFYWNEVVRNIKISPFADYEHFKFEIERSCSMVSTKLIKKTVESFTKRVRNVENAYGEYVLK